MERYETIAIASPLIADEDINQLIASLEKVIADGGGSVLRVDRWGKRRLAYRIKKFEEGNYALIFYEASGDLVKELERRIRIDDRLIRFMTVHVDWEEKVARAEAERLARGPRSRYGERRESEDHVHGRDEDLDEGLGEADLMV